MGSRSFLWQFIVFISILWIGTLFSFILLFQSYLLTVLVVLLVFTLICGFILFRLYTGINEISHKAESILAEQPSLKERLHPFGSKELNRLDKAIQEIAKSFVERSSKYRIKKSEQGAILASMREGVLAVDQKDKVSHINLAAQKMLEVSGDLKGRSVYELIRIPKLQSFIQASLQDEPKAGELRQEEIALNFESEKDVQFLSISGAPLRDGEGQNGGMVFVISDVTDIRRLERMRKEFVANVSHELKTPLTSIKGFAETIVDLPEEQIDPTVKNFVGIIQKQADRLETLIEDLMMLSKLEKDKGSAEVLSRQQVGATLSAAIELCRMKAENKKIELLTDFQSTAEINLNSGLFEQAVINLVDNAIKYSPEFSQVEVSSYDLEKQVIIQIKDQGIGIEQKHLPQLFERFYRVDKGRSRSMGGTGLGLSIVKHIIQAHNGVISVESQIGEGSRFTISLPHTV